MTLVVARRFEGRTYMVGDTMYAPEVTDGREGQRHFIGALKIVILHPGLVIAFANNGPNAQRAIEGIHSNGLNLFDKTAVLSYFLEHHRRSQQGGPGAVVEFIAAIVLDDQTSELFLIKSGDVVHVEAGYIGNVYAYNRFLHRERQVAATAQTPSSLGVAMDALRAVIRDPDPELKSVDGLTVGLRQCAEDGFLYVHSCTAEGRAIPVYDGPWAPVTFGGAPEGANTWNIGSRPGDRLGVLTAFCHTGEFGVIFCPVLNFAPRIIRNCTESGLMDASMLEVNQVVALLNPSSN